MEPWAMDYLADPFFYESPTSAPPLRGRRYRLPLDLDWSSWEQRTAGGWHSVHPGTPLPDQGWKIHASTTPAGAPALLAAIATYAWEHRLSFKFIPSEQELLARDGKQAHRGSAGKFLTLYPRDVDELERTLIDLDAIVGGHEGPYILSDLRWNDGPLAVRYGGFSARTARVDGKTVPVLLDPAGVPVADRRTAEFFVPPWVDVPEFLARQMRALSDSAPPASFRYGIREALHFSNAGGIYRADALDHPGTTVILKEARPHAGLTPDGRDAIARLRHEADMLSRLADEPAVVGMREVVAVGDHLFLVLDDIPGTTLNEAMTGRSPQVRADSTPADRRAYRDWALELLARLTAVVERLHDRGVVHRDLHPRNILVLPDGDVKLIDFEMARSLDDDESVTLAAPGFTPPPDRVGADADRWALAALCLHMFVPLTPLLGLDSGKAEELIAAAARDYALPDAVVSTLRRTLAAPPPRHPRSALARDADDVRAEWPVHDDTGIRAIQRLIRTSIDAAADYGRADRAFPGDPRQFRESGIGLAHGATGVMHALTTSGHPVPEAAVRWVADAVDNEPRLRPGLWDGAAGVSWALRRCGEPAAAASLLRRVRHGLRGAAGDPLDLDLYGGLAGIGVFLLDEGSDDSRDLALDLGDRLRVRLAAGERFPDEPRRAGIGLLRGHTGAALFGLRLFEATRDERHLQFARECLDVDLARCVPAADGGLHLDEGWRLMPYLGGGSAGVAVVAAQLTPYLDDPEPVERVIAGIRIALSAPFTIESTLFTGRAGVIHALVALERLGYGTEQSRRALDHHAEGLHLHALAHSAGIAFAGAGLLRASTDLATGSAGVLTALEAYRALRFDPESRGWENHLPLVIAPPPEQSAASPGKGVKHHVRIPPEPSALRHDGGR